MSDSGKNKESSRSSRLRKYERAYNKYILNATNQKKSRYRSRHKTDEENTVVRRKRKKDKESNDQQIDKPTLPNPSLNSYQKFVREESKKDKYRAMRASERLQAIALAWKRKQKRKETDKQSSRTTRKKRTK